MKRPATAWVRSSRLKARKSVRPNFQGHHLHNGGCLASEMRPHNIVPGHRQKRTGRLCNDYLAISAVSDSLLV